MGKLLAEDIRRFVSLLNRSLLSIGDYSIKVNWRYQIGSVRNDTSWRAIIRAKDNKRAHDTLSA